jgi:hypothetical protein
MYFNYYVGLHKGGRYYYSYITEEQALKKIEQMKEGNMDYDTEKRRSNVLL